MKSTDMFKDFPDSLLNKFKEFHAKNPHVYSRFKELAFEMKKSGRKKYSAEIIINKMRWESDLQTNGDTFRIRNDFKPILARLLVFHHPEFKDFFDFRKITHRGIVSEKKWKEKPESISSAMWGE